MLLEYLPDPEMIEGKVSILKADIKTQKSWYEYFDIVKSPEEILQDTINALGQSIAEEKIKSIPKDALISSLGQKLTKVKLDIM